MKRILCLFFLFLLSANLGAQDTGTHARRVLDLLKQEKFEDVAKDFNAAMAGALPVQALRQTWSTIRAQAGEIKSEIDQQVVPFQGGTAVTLGVQFERAALNITVAFDSANKIAGLQITPRVQVAAAALPPGLTEEAFTVGGGDFPLPGTLTLPQGTGRAPAVVLVHGSGPEDRDETIGGNKPFRDLAFGLASRGIAVLRYEKRTKEYPGKMALDSTITVRQETIEDAVLAAQGLRKHPRIDGTRIFVLGHSLGGMVAPRVGQEDKQLAGLIVMAGSFRPLTELMVEQVEYLASITPDPTAQALLPVIKQQVARIQDPALPLDTPASELMGAPASYWKDLNAYKPGNAAAALSLPMLFLQGERDYQVTMTDFEGWRGALKGHTNATFKSYPDLNHLFMTGTGKSVPAEYQKPGKVSETVIDDIAAWVKAH